MVDSRLVRDRLKRHQRRERGNYFKLKKGKNIIRILTFRHELNKFDVVAKRCDEEDVGRAVELFFADGERLWQGGGFSNCLPDQSECPLWQDFFNRPKGPNRKDYAPDSYYVMNIVDMAEPHRGVQVFETRNSVMLGERDNQGRKIGYGIIDYFQGFDPSKLATDGEEEEDEDDDEDVDTSAARVAASLVKLPAHGDGLFGLKGRDIIIYGRESTFGGVQPDNDRQHGAIVLRKQEACDVLAKHFLKGVKDLWAMPEYYPGYSRKSKNLWIHAEEFVEHFSPSKVKNEAEDTEEEDDDVEAPGEGQPDGEEPETETATTQKKRKKRRSKKQAPAQKARSRKKEQIRIEKGADIVWIDRYNEDNTKLMPEKSWKYFRGTFDHWEDGETGWIVCRPEQQVEDERREELEGFWNDATDDVKEKGGPFIIAKREDIKLADEFDKGDS